MENRQTNQKSASANFRALHIPFRKYMIVAVYSQPLVRKNQKFEKVLKNKLQVIFEITAFIFFSGIEICYKHMLELSWKKIFFVRNFYMVPNLYINIRKNEKNALF